MEAKELAKMAFSRDLMDIGALEDAFSIVRLVSKEDMRYARELNKKIRESAGKGAAQGNTMRFLDILKKSLLLDAPYDFDAAIRYAEWNREPKKRFYTPRRKQLYPIVKAMERLENREIRILGVMSPPGVGKALANDTPVLTRYGWKNHGDLVVGDEVIGLDGGLKKVIAVHPKCDLDVLIEFFDGSEKIQCHENHEWLIRKGITNKTDIVETKWIINSGFNLNFITIPYSGKTWAQDIGIRHIKRVDKKQGNCITVEGGMYRVGHKLIPTHNTTIELMFMVWSGMRNPELSILMGSHSNSFLRGAYAEIIRMLDAKGEYLWNDIFPYSGLVKTNALDMRIDLKNEKRFETLEFSSIGSGNAGKVRASNVLVADDLVDGIESAMSKERMDKLWQQYYTDMMQRMMGDCVQLLVQTPWTLHDPIDRLERMNYDNPAAEFIHIPALDENDESNFDYPYGVGFTTEFYHKQRDIMDDASWRSLYMTEPIEREGQLYNEDELRRYFELPSREPDAIISVCDTKDRGTDYCVMPIAYQYGNDFYIEDVVCDNSNPEIVEARLVSKLLKHKVQMSRFESNSAGGKVAEKVQKEVKEKGGITKITTKYTTANKETKIIISSPYAKEHFLFKDSSVIKKDREYRLFLNQICSYTMAGKNKHDDSVDSLAMLVDFIQSFEASKVEVFKRPF